jgi:hypothetical protein
MLLIQQGLPYQRERRRHGCIQKPVSPIVPSSFKEADIFLRLPLGERLFSDCPLILGMDEWSIHLYWSLSDIQDQGQDYPKSMEEKIFSS